MFDSFVGMNVDLYDVLRCHWSRQGNDKKVKALR